MYDIDVLTLTDDVWSSVIFCLFFFFFKQKTAYEMRISDWSSDVCSSDLVRGARSPELARASGVSRQSRDPRVAPRCQRCRTGYACSSRWWSGERPRRAFLAAGAESAGRECRSGGRPGAVDWAPRRRFQPRSEEHTSELQSLMRNSYAVFCLQKKTQHKHSHT